MDTKLISAHLQKLHAARENLASCIRAREIVENAGSHQSAISIKCGDVTVDVTEMDRCYMQSIIRGREMIALGIKKALNGKIDAARDKVRLIETEIKAMTHGENP